MMNALDYLEENMGGDLDMDEAAGIACSSPFHFQRTFHILTGVTVAEYVRKRRLTLAAQELASTRAKVIDVALKYGYDTPEAFCKAFRRAHGITPSDARRPETRLKVFPRMSFHIELKGDQEMDYRITEKPAFTVLAKGVRVSTKDGEHTRRIPAFWQESMGNGTIDTVVRSLKHDGITERAMLGVCADFESDLQEFTYSIAVETGDNAAPAGFELRTIPAANWAVFDSVGAIPDAIQKTFTRIFSEFFPSTGYEHAEGLPEIEVYPAGDISSADYRCEVWIPIVKK
jgi:AraC family transcriptional regulator